MSIGKQAMISIVRQDGLRSSFPVSMGSKETCNWPLKTDRMSCMERRRVASLHISLSLSRSVCLHACAVHLLLLLFLSLSLSRYFKQPLTELYSSVTNDRTNRVHESNFRFRDRPAKFVTRFESWPRNPISFSRRSDRDYCYYYCCCRFGERKKIR